MADHNKPTTTSNYTDLITEFDGRLDDQALGYDPATCSPTNVKTNALGWSSASNKWQRFNGSTWVDMSSLYAINISGNAATATSATNATQLGGQAASYYAPKASPTFTGIASFEKIANATLFANGAGAEGGELRLEKPATGSTLVGNVIVDIFGDYVRIFDAGGTNKGARFSIVACENSAATTLWNSSNDGAGSGMNADLLDGYQSSTGTTASTVPVRDGSGKLPGDITGNAATVTNGVYANQSNTYGAGAVQTVILNTNEGIATSPDGTHGVEVRGNGTGGAFMTFNRPGSFAAQFGIDTDNKWKVGGWSMGDNAYNLIHSGVLGTGLSFDGTNLNCTVASPVSSVNGQTGAVTVAPGFTTATQTPTGSGVALFSGIPSGVKLITIALSGISSSSATGGGVTVQLGDSSGIETSGYYYSDASSTLTNQASMRVGVMPALSASTLNAVITLAKGAGNGWVIASNSMSPSDPSGPGNFIGAKTLSAELTQLNVSLVYGNFDAGSISVSYS